MVNMEEYLEIGRLSVCSKFFSSPSQNNGLNGMK